MGMTEATYVLRTRGLSDTVVNPIQLSFIVRNARHNRPDWDRLMEASRSTKRRVSTFTVAYADRQTSA